ncbi:hypothetical protein AAF712_010902 [Marasmius tenuissimus]|uniref:RING-type domain-containing protein n=1 Tax=Marasmius tenuissimus TaxID=585030 RepID=A0ABR2ZKN0_9AGAR
MQPETDQSQQHYEALNDENIQLKCQSQALQNEVAVAHDKIAVLRSQLFISQQYCGDLERRRRIIELELSQTQHAITETRVRVDEILNALECDVCMEVSSVTWGLGCGHTFCTECLLGWFTSVRASYMQSAPDYDPMFSNYRASLTMDERRVLSRSRHVHEVVAVLNSKTYQSPPYSCPTCRYVACDPPAQIYRLKDVLTAAKSDSTSVDIDGPNPSNPWREFWLRQTQLVHITL